MGLITRLQLLLGVVFQYKMRPVFLYLLTLAMVNISNTKKYLAEIEDELPKETDVVNGDNDSDDSDDDAAGGDCKCGLANRKASLNKSGSGTDAEENEYPWHALLITGTEKMLCGGAIINSKWILTSAKCVQRGFITFENVDEVEVKIGSNIHHLKKIKTKVSKIVVGKDLGLVKLANPLDFAANPHIRPICLPEDKDEQYVDAKAIVTGWGRESLYQLKPTENLQEVAVRVISRKECAKKSSLEVPISPNMICTSPKADAGCKGDKGGPLVTSNGGDGETAGQNYELIGMLLYNDANCNGTYAIVYTRVTAELDWIKKTTSSDGETCPRT